MLVRLHAHSRPGVVLLLGCQPWQKDLICREVRRHNLGSSSIGGGGGGSGGGGGGVEGGGGGHGGGGGRGGGGGEGGPSGEEHSREAEEEGVPIDISNEVRPWQRGLYSCTRDLRVRQLVCMHCHHLHIPPDMLLRHHLPPPPLPFLRPSQVSAVERIELYKTPACCFVTTRILVVDLLCARVLPRNIAGGWVVRRGVGGDALPVPFQSWVGLHCLVGFPLPPPLGNPPSASLCLTSMLCCRAQASSLSTHTE